MTSRRVPILIWLCVMAVAVLIVARLRIDTDMTAFLPRTPSPAQRVLVDQLRDGVVSRLVLVAIEGMPVARSAPASKALAAALRTDADIVGVENGEDGGFARDRDFLWANRYLLSDRTRPESFTAASLRAALQADLAALASNAGFLVKRTLDSDPTGELLHLIEQQMGDGGGPARRDGVWVSPDGGRALLLVRLRAAGADLDGAQRALAAIRRAFDAATPDHAGRLILTGPPVFAVAARDRIKSDATRLSTLASLLVAAVLLAVYRSPRVLVLAFVPVVSGALVGIAAVGLVFRTIHGITLGFGATLIGEAVDYAVYLFTQTPQGGQVETTLKRIWPTLRLGVLTSICGFSAMLLSSFEGFAQLGLFTIAGLAVAVCVTRFVLPALVPSRFAGVRESRTVMRLAAFATRGRRLRPVIFLLAFAAVASLAMGREIYWAGDLSSLSPVPPAAQALDRALRQDMHAPDAGTLIVIRQPELQVALASAERLATALAALVPTGALAGFDTPTRTLPSLATQRARQESLPEPAALQAALSAALEGLPFRPGLFAPFVAAIADARAHPPLTRADLDGTSLSLKLDSLLLHQGDGWVAMLSLRGVTATPAIAQAVAAEQGAVLVDLKAESNRLLSVYLREAVSLASLGAVAIVLLLAVSLRSLRRLAAVTAPLVVAVIVTLAVLRLGGHALSILNLFGLLLVVAIGSNYCLFFDRHRDDPAGMPRTLASLLLANVCTVAGFGVLATSTTPVLHDLGLPVAIGTLLSLVFATIMMSPPHAPATRPDTSGGAPPDKPLVRDTLLVMVPGAGMQAHDFHSEGLAAAVVQPGRNVSIHTIDPGMESYLDGSVEPRLLAGIAAAQAASGATRIWLAGISLGCKAILRCVRARPGLAEGVILLTPYVASTGLVARIGQAGGLRAWAASGGGDAEPDAALLAWLATAHPETLPRILLGHAQADRFGATATMLAELLPADEISRVPGGHDWTSWRALWRLMLDREPFARAATIAP